MKQGVSELYAINDRGALQDVSMSQKDTVNVGSEMLL
jgi:hypothetical protein